jgi:hypothetical protein
MEPWREIGKALLILGAVIAAVGAFLYFSGRLPFRLGRLPGDVSWQGKHTTVYFPIVTCIVISVILTLIFWVIGQFRR